MVFDKPEFSIKKPEAHSGYTHKLVIGLENGIYIQTDIVIGSGFYHYLKSTSRSTKLKDICFYIDQESNKLFFGVRDVTGDKLELDLWCYTQSNLPQFISLLIRKKGKK